MHLYQSRNADWPELLSRGDYSGPVFTFRHLYGSVRGHLIEILICFQRSACSSFPSRGLSKQARLTQSIALMNMLIKLGKRPSLEALQVSRGRRLISLPRPPPRPPRRASIKGAVLCLSEQLPIHLLRGGGIRG